MLDVKEWPDETVLRKVDKKSHGTILFRDSTYYSTNFQVVRLVLLLGMCKLYIPSIIFMHNFWPVSSVMHYLHNTVSGNVL
jgi:hypothetical protein